MIRRQLVNSPSLLDNDLCSYFEIKRAILVCMVLKGSDIKLGLESFDAFTLNALNVESVSGEFSQDASIPHLLCSAF